MKRVIPAAVALAVAGALYAPSASLAGGMDKKFYVGGAAGIAMRSDEKAKVNFLGREGFSTTKYDMGMAFAGYAGYDFGKIRSDLEIRYSSSDGSKGSAEVSDLAFMANAYYDFELKNAKITPYVGAGLGLVHVSADLTSRLPSGGTAKLSESDTVFGGQAILGASYPWSDRVSLTADYRFMYASGATLKKNVAGNEIKVETRGSMTHHFLLGVRVAF